MQPIFPFEIFELIAFKSPKAFKLIYQTCKQMTQMDVSKVMDESTIKISEGRGNIKYILPNRTLHRGYDLPAVTYADGYQAWYKNGLLHRDDLPAIIDIDGYQAWYKNGRLYRDDGPAIIYSNYKQVWYQNGQIHRDNGPAIIYADGKQEWYINGEKIKQ